MQARRVQFVVMSLVIAIALILTWRAKKLERKTPGLVNLAIASSNSVPTNPAPLKSVHNTFPSVNLEDVELHITNIVEKVQKSCRSGDVAVVGSILEALRIDFRGRDLSDNERVAYLRLIEGLGFLSGKSEEAFNFLLIGTDPGYWQQTRTWRNRYPSVEEIQDKMLAGNCLVALAISGQSQASTIRDEWLNYPKEDLKILGGFITSCAMHLDMNDRLGNEEYLRELNQIGEFGVGPRWNLTPSGKKWMGWYRSLYNFSSE